MWLISTKIGLFAYLNFVFTEVSYQFIALSFKQFFNTGCIYKQQKLFRGRKPHQRLDCLPIETLQRGQESQLQ